MAASVDFDRVLHDIGQFGRFQVGLYGLLMLMELVGSMHHLGQVFLAGSMDYECLDLEFANSSDQCSIKDNVTGLEMYCNNWEYDRSAYTSTLVSEFNLVCDRLWLQAMSQTIYMSGVLIGVVVFGALADRFGRHKILMLTTILMVITGTGAAFMPTYWSFVMTRMLVGAVAGGNMTTLFVLVVEAIGGPARTYCGIMVQSFFGMGTMVMAGLGLFVTEYRHLQLIISLAYVLFLTYYWIVPESLRWQLSQGQEHKEDVMKTVRLIAKINRRSCPKNLDDYTEQPSLTPKVKAEGTATMFDLFKTPNLRCKTINLYFNWFVNSLVYYGISLMATDLAGNIYFNTFLSGLSEFLACITFGPLTQRLGRRSNLSFCLLLGGILCFAAIPIPQNLAVLRTVLAMIGKFFIAGSFAIVYVYSAELFPTVVRNAGVGSCSMCARIGGLIAPFIALLNKVWKPLPFFVFGGLALMAGMLTLLLPETMDQKLPDTLEEGENFGKGQRPPCLSVCYQEDKDLRQSEILYAETTVD